MEKMEIRKFEEEARLLRVLGHPMRLAIIETLSKRPWCVCELANNLGLNKSATSKHLSLLKSVGVIDMERDGTQVNCNLVMPCVLELMHCGNRSTIHKEISRKPLESETIIASASCCNIKSTKEKH